MKTEDLTMTFGEFYELYYTYISKRIKLNTLRTKTTIFENKILPYFKEKRMCDIKPSDVIKWQNVMSSITDYSKKTIDHLRHTQLFHTFV